MTIIDSHNSREEIAKIQVLYDRAKRKGMNAWLPRLQAQLDARKENMRTGNALVPSDKEER